jgi:hypothetical protein
MSPKVTNSQSSRPRTLDKDRCRFTSAHGRRCLNPLRSATAGFCIIHERFNEQQTDADVQSVSSELLSGGPNLLNREEVGRVIAQLFTLIAEQRIKPRHGALLAYVASLLLQTMGHTPIPPPLPVRVVWGIPMHSDRENPTNEKDNAPHNPIPDPRSPNRNP